MGSLERDLRGGLLRLDLSLNEGQITRLLDYLGLIQKWTNTYNLTSLREPAEMLTHHLLDSLAVIGPLRKQLACLMPVASLLDVGTGAGLPGVVVAICCADIEVSSVDAVSKKVAFIRHVAGVLKLSNLKALHARVEDLSGCYTIVSSRAFASLSDFVRLSGRVLAPGGIWMAMKGKRPEDEISALSDQALVFHVEPLSVPGLVAERCIVWMRKT